MGKKMMLKEKKAVYEAAGNTIIVSEVEKIVERIVDRKLQELLGDPDYGLKLREEFARKLGGMLRKDKETIPEEKIAKKYGVEL